MVCAQCADCIGFDPLDKAAARLYDAGMNLDWLAIVLRWMHILAACAAVGGTIFMRLALLPAMSSLSDESRKTLHEQLGQRWGQVVKWVIAFLLISGLWNFYNINTQYDLKKIQLNHIPIYHLLFGVKFLLAVGVFFIASVLTGKSKAFDSMRAKRKFWLTLNLALMVLIVCISGVLRTVEKPKKALPSLSTPGIRSEHNLLLPTAVVPIRLEYGIATRTVL